VCDKLGKAKLSEQERLVAGLLKPSNLLDALRHFTLFMNVDGQTVKAVCRYQQYRAVSRAIERLRTGKTRPRMASMTGAAASSGRPRTRARA
jgi:type I restriction enzyme, R subunit